MLPRLIGDGLTDGERQTLTASEAELAREMIGLARQRVEQHARLLDVLTEVKHHLGRSALNTDEEETVLLIVADVAVARALRLGATAPRHPSR